MATESINATGLRRFVAAGVWFSLVCAGAPPLHAQPGAETVTQRLVLTARVWGLAKYRHPDVTACRREWDQILVDALPGIEAATDDAAFDQEIAGLLTQAGAIAGRAPDAQTPMWITQASLSSANKATLAAIAAFRPASQCYVQPWRDAEGQAKFSSDTAFNGSPLTRQIRLLGAFRFWNAAEYFFGYKDLIGRPWPDALAQHVLDIADAPTARAYAAAIVQLSAELNDSHGYTGSPHLPGILSPPFFARHVENKVIVMKALPSASGVHAGDEVVAVNDEAIASTVARMDGVSYGSNPAARRSNALAMALGDAATTHRYTMQHSDGTRHEFSGIPSYSYYEPLHYPPGAGWRLIPAGGDRTCSAAVVNLGTIKQGEVAPLLDTLRNVDLLVLDSRVYPSDHMADFAVLDAIIEQQPFHVAYWVPDFADPGSYRQLSDAELPAIGSATPVAFPGRIEVLVDDQSVSSSEFMAMMAQARPRTLVFGSQTQGADGEISEGLVLPGEIWPYFTSNRLRYRDGRQSQRIGIVPDVQVVPTVAGVRAGRDEVLDAALDCRWKNESPSPRRPRSGLYVSGARRGEGVEVQKLGDIYASYLYAYDDQGLPEWEMSTSRFEAGASNGELLHFAPDASYVVKGALSVDFHRGPYDVACAVADQSRVPGGGATLKWPPTDDGANICLGPLLYGDSSALSGLWAGAQGELAWGMSLHHNGSTLVVLLYAYDGQGKPRWMGGTVAWDGHGEIHVPMRRSKGVCRACAPQPVVIEEAGEIVLSLPDPARGVVAGNWADVDVTFHDGHRLRRHRMALKHL